MQRSPGHKALRHGRTSECGRIYHVTFATAGRHRWFHAPALARAACRTFLPSAEAAETRLLCWVLMPDHFHGLIQPLGSQSLSRCVQRLNGQATLACREVYDRAEIWSRGFHGHAMRKDEDMLATARYIVANPVRACLAPSAMQYPYWNAIWL